MTEDNTVDLEIYVEKATGRELHVDLGWKKTIIPRAEIKAYHYGLGNILCAVSLSKQYARENDLIL